MSGLTLPTWTTVRRRPTPKTKPEKPTTSPKTPPGALGFSTSFLLDKRVIKEQNIIDHRTLAQPFEKGLPLDFYPSLMEEGKPRRVLVGTPEDDVAFRCVPGFRRLQHRGWQVSVVSCAAGARHRQQAPEPPTIALVRLSLAQDIHGVPYQQEATAEGALELVSHLRYYAVPVIPWTPEIGLGRPCCPQAVSKMERLTHQCAFSSLAGACMQDALAAILDGTDPYISR